MNYIIIIRFLLALLPFHIIENRANINVQTKVVDSGKLQVVAMAEEVIEDKKIELQIGKLSGYGPDCVGCSGYTASGNYVGDGTIYYNDYQFGKVRIVAADSKYKFGTIVKISHPNLEEDIIAIVLDRGSAIGFQRIALFDLLYSSEEEANLKGVFHNTTFEILRYGY